MSSRIRLQLDITHQGTFVDYLTKNQLLRLHNLLQIGGQKRINNKWYEASSTSFVVYKSKKFGGANYAFNLNNSQKIVLELLND